MNAHPVFVAVSALLDRVSTGHDKPTLEDFMAAMQPAEELGGPEGADYIGLMVAIRDEAKFRWVGILPDTDESRLTAALWAETTRRLVAAGDR
jgi:hypothetical protein